MITSLYLAPDGQLKQNLEDDDLRKAVRSGQGLLWVDFHKPTPDEVFKLDEVFGFHALSIEDCTHVSQFPKLDDFGTHLFIVFMAPNPKFKPGLDEPAGEDAEEPVLELDMFLGANYVVTYHVTQLPFLAALLERGRREPKRLLARSASFLAHDIIDAAVDQFFAMVDRFQGEAEESENKLLKEDKESLPGVLELKRRVLHLRRQMSDHRELIQRMLRGNHPVVVPEAHIYFRNILDHLHRIEDDLDVCRDTIDNARDAYLAIANARTNEVMKILTLVFTLSLPFSILTSFYGMNFHHLPGLEHPSGPWIISAVMCLMAMLMVLWLKAKRWL